MKNNSIIELQDCTLVLAFGKELPDFLLNEMRKNERTIHWYDGTAMTSEEFMGSVEQTLLNEKCRKVVLDAGYEVNGMFLAYRCNKYLMAEDSTQWWYIKDIGDRLAVIGYEIYYDDEYHTVFDYRNLKFERGIRSSFDHNFCGFSLNNKTIGDERTPYVCGYQDHITGENYYVTREIAHKFLTDNERFLQDGEQAIVAGNLVRCMTYSEECAYNEDRLFALVDLWGNIAVDEEPNERWIRAML